MRILLYLYGGIEGHIELLRADWTKQGPKAAAGMFVESI